MKCSFSPIRRSPVVTLLPNDVAENAALLFSQSGARNPRPLPGRAGGTTGKAISWVWGCSTVAPAARAEILEHQDVSETVVFL